MTRAFAFGVLSLLWMAVPAAADAGWGAYGGDQGGMRYSDAAEITRANVDDLISVWTYSTGDMMKRDAKTMRRTKFQATPILVGDKLITCSSFNEVIALDPGTGKEIWRFDPKIVTENVRPANKFNCRGVAVHLDQREAQIGVQPPCQNRVLAATSDGRVLALKLETGEPCSDFGANGNVKVDPGMGLVWPGEFQITSAPVIIGNVVIVGSAIGDNTRVAAPHGTVRAFDVETGKPKWSWDPVPRDANDPAAKTWGDGYKDVGHANVWAPMSVDEKRGLVFMPTSSASPDFFGGLRPGDNKHSNSVVALKAETGELVWAFQTVHHDVWDYDNPAQPTLATITFEGRPRDVVIQPTKQGFVFVLDRDTGVPVFPVEERAVPQGGVAGEVLSPTQPYPTLIPALVPQKISADEAFGITPWDRNACREQLASARSEGLYTPPTEQGTLLFPFTGGGMNWGGVSVDPVSQVLYANTSRAVHKITMFPAAQYEAMKAKYPDKEVSPQKGAAYGMIRETVLSPLGVPCNPPPWGVLAAIDLKTGKVKWESTIGTTEDLVPLGIAMKWGTPTLGGSLVTAGGLVFIGSTMDKYLRAFDAKTGEELWQGRLPTTGNATPMTYQWKGRQFVVIAAGGHGDLGSSPGDTFVAFAVAGPNDPKPTWWSRKIDRPGGRMWMNFALIFAGTLVVVGGLWWLIKRWRRK
ncbi:MAG: pyrroloquinoline quinone-dependent dehydrogenase [Alphaproteobacteria bacterium]|nr:pyrroloquinoline quinone-dependent dehydrogenase [Alphaproteobacteria bacterium]